MTVEEFLRVFPTPPQKTRSGEWMLRCPAHEDKHPSLFVREVDGRILLKCFAGCSAESILSAVGLSFSDLFDGKLTVSKKDNLEDVYVYESESGVPLYRVRRLKNKDFRVETCVDGSWVKGLAKDVQRVLYRLPAVKKAIKEGGEIYYVEGEKDADALTLRGVTATTHAGGANAWRDELADYLTGAKRVCIVRDMDMPGLSMALAIRRALRERNVPVTILEPKVGKDAYDHLKLYGVEDFRPYLSQAIGLSGIAQEDVRFVMYPYLPRGAVALLDGKMGIGKTYFALKIVSAISKGEKLFTNDGRWGECLKGKVLYVSYEDDPAIILKPRLTALKANLENVFAYFPVGSGIQGLEEILLEAETLGVDLIVIDPFFLLVSEDVNAYKSAREMMVTLAKAIRQTGMAVLAIRHTTKVEKASPLDKGLGSVGWLASARSGLLAERKGAGLRIRHIKHNWSPAMPDLQATLKEDGDVEIALAEDVEPVATDAWDEVDWDEYREEFPEV